MKAKSVLFLSMLLSAAFIAPSSFAADINNTKAITLADDGDGGFNSHFGDNFTSMTTNQSFADKFTFTIDKSFDSSASLTSAYLSTLTTVKDLNITGFSMAAYDPVTKMAIGPIYAGTNGTAAGLNQTDSWSLTTMGLKAGTYYIEVDGTVAGKGGGSFGTDLTIAAAVPEPETYGMLVGGLGLIGLVARRRKSNRA